jgi:hypothetical protein
MAIIHDIPNFEITIWSGGEKLLEYAAPDEVANEDQNDTTASKYIEAKSGAEYELRIKVLKGYKIDCDHLAILCRIDGRFVGGNIVKPSVMQYGYDSTISGCKTRETPQSPVLLRRFMFAALETGKIQSFTFEIENI